MKGYIHSFESLATLDGAGVRYGVFMQGCPLRCAFCHNPDTWSKNGAATEMEPSELVRKLERYKPYFGKDGGVTFSGGEPLIQAEFIEECVPYLREKGIGYIIDTSGAVELTESVKFVLNNSQGVILDLKFPDDEGYVRYTGMNMTKTMTILRYLENIGKPTVVRTVVIPDVNDSETEIEKYVALVKNLKCIEKYELLAFHTMGFFKYEKLGIRNPFSEKKALDAEVKERLQRYADEKMNYKNEASMTVI